MELLDKATEVGKVVEEAEKALREVKKWTADSGAELAAVYGKMKKNGKTSVEHIVKWMKEVKLITSKEHEEKVRSDLDKAADKKDVNFQHFRDTVFNMVDQHKKTFEEMGAAVKTKGGKMATALQAGTSAFTDALGKIEEKKE